jgi:hypothetical protein
MAIFFFTSLASFKSWPTRMRIWAKAPPMRPHQAADVCQPDACLRLGPSKRFLFLSHLHASLPTCCPFATFTALTSFFRHSHPSIHPATIPPAYNFPAFLLPPTISPSLRRFSSFSVAILSSLQHSSLSRYLFYRTLLRLFARS